MNESLPGLLSHLRRMEDEIPEFPDSESTRCTCLISPEITVNPLTSTQIGRLVYIYLDFYHIDASMMMR
jgi:hypothetical protein